MTSFYTWLGLALSCHSSALDAINKPFTRFARIYWLVFIWLEPKVKTQEEYNIFKALLFAHINHPNQVAILGTANCDR